MTADWLLAVGCSLTWGTETTCPGESLPEDKNNAWPAHLGKLLGTSNVINCGWPGRSNASIFRVAMEEMAKCRELYGSNGIVVIQWSGLSRLEFVNPFMFDVQEFYHNAFQQQQHPGQEGPYMCVSPAEVGNRVIQQRFPGLVQFFVNNWSHDFYQTELLVNHSIALTNLATKLGINIIQFNGIDEIVAEHMPAHARHMFNLLGKEYYKPYDRTSAFWPATMDFPRYVVDSNTLTKNSKIPPHPPTEKHQQWAKVLHDYIVDNQLAKSL